MCNVCYGLIKFAQLVTFDGLSSLCVDMYYGVFQMGIQISKLDNETITSSSTPHTRSILQFTTKLPKGTVQQSSAAAREPVRESTPEPFEDDDSR